MSDTSTEDFFVRQAREAREAEPPGPRRHGRGGKPGKRSGRGRKARRIALCSGAALLTLTGAAAGASYLTINHLASSVHRIPNVFVGLTAAERPVMPAASRHSMTVLLTGSFTEPAVRGGGGVDGSSTAPENLSGLIALIHLNANGRAGAVVSIPPNAVVTVPGHGRQQLWDTLTEGGPSLLIRTVEKLTKVRVDHYSVLDFSGVVHVINALGGVQVQVPYTVNSEGFTFPAGTDHLNGKNVLPYVRQPGVSEIGRVLLQQNLTRTILVKTAHVLLHHPTSDLGVLRALTSALSVDSDFSNSALEHLGLNLSHLQGSAGTFISAPTRDGSPVLGGTSDVHLDKRITRQLWSAIRHDSVAAFAQRYPATVTTGAPG
ncbi:MAG: LCP family protein [Actinomycetota bacterium]